LANKEKNQNIDKKTQIQEFLKEIEVWKVLGFGFDFSKFDLSEMNLCFRKIILEFRKLKQRVGNSCVRQII
jgi:hypothetical protein